MAATMHIDVVSAEESIYSGEAEFVVLPGVEGELGIYPRHTPLITQIKAGTVRIRVPGRTRMNWCTYRVASSRCSPITLMCSPIPRSAPPTSTRPRCSRRSGSAEEAIRARTEKHEIATAEAELAAISAQLQAIQKLRRAKR